MSKIGIATFFDDNFGTCLQAYALQQTLLRLGYKSEIIKYYRGAKAVKTEPRWKKIFRYSPSVVIKHFLNHGMIERKRNAFIGFRSKSLAFSDKAYYRDTDLDELNNQYDAFVCGSDMIWSEDFQKDWKFLYLTFADKDRSIAYAPSFGKNHLCDANIQICNDYINGIKFLSCRELAGVELIKKHFNIVAEHVIDPTLLLSAAEWNKLLANEERMVAPRYNLAYVFLGTKNGREQIFKQLQQQNDRKLIFLSGADGSYRKYMYKGSAGPFEFVRMYRDSEFVATDTFHGMLFAIIFQKPFVVLAKEPFGVSADRLKYTLASLGLEDRYIGYDTVLDERYLTLDYTPVMEKLSTLQDKSMAYIRRALSSVITNCKE